MSTEDQSSEDNLKRAQEQARKALGLVGVPPVYEMEPVVHVGAKQQAAARSDFRHAHDDDDDVLNDTFGRQLLALAVSNDKGDTITAADIDALADEIEAICKNAGVSQDEIVEIIEKLNANIGAPKSGMGAIKEAAKNMANTVVSAAVAGKAESPEAKMDRLWGDISKLDKKIDERLSKIDYLKTDEEKKLEAEAKERVAKAKAEEERVLNDPNATEEQKQKARQARVDAETGLVGIQQGIATRIKNDPNTTPQEKEIAEQANELLREKLAKLEKIQTELDGLKKQNLKAKYPSMSDQQIEEVLDIDRQKRQKDREEFKNSVALTKIDDAISLSLNQIDKLSAPAEKTTVVKTTQGEVEPSNKFAVVQASRTEPVAPASVPTDDFGLSNTTVGRTT